MRLKLVITSILLGITISASAQRYREDFVINRHSPKYSPINMIYGVMAGATINATSVEGGALSIDSSVGGQIGMMWGVDLGTVEIVPEFWYQFNSAKATQRDTSEGEEGDLVTNCVEVPIIVAIELGGGVRFNVGTSLSLMCNSQFTSLKGEVSDFGRTRSTAGYLVGFSFTTPSNIIIDARYTGRLGATSGSEYLDINTEQYEFRNLNFGINVGYRF